MATVDPNDTQAPVADDCTICLASLAPGTTVLTLSCNHKFHLQCLASNVQAQNKECPLCRAAIDDSVVQLLAGQKATPAPQPSPFQIPRPTTLPVELPPSVEEPVDESTLQAIAERQAATPNPSTDTTNLPLITAVTTFEYEAQDSQIESNIYGLVTLEAPSIPQAEIDSMRSSRVPLDLICVLDQSGSMSGEKIRLLKETMVYIVEQLNQLDRLAVISFNTTAVDRSRGLKRMNEQNQQTLKDTINNDIQSTGGTYIGTGLQMAIDLLRQRQTKNPLAAILLLTDGQDNEEHDYTDLMKNLPEGVQCHTFGYGPDHTASLLVKLAEQGNSGTFTYVDQNSAIGPAFAMALGGLFTCVAKQIQVDVEFNGDYKVTHFHSQYPYEPTQLPSNKLSIKLANLNADEKRNLVFQLHVPALTNSQNVEMNSQEPMSQDASSDVQPKFESQPIGHVTITYVEPKTSRSLTTDAVEFRLIRVPQPPAEILRVNQTLDRQRNRIETTLVLEQAMNEPDFDRSREILKRQAAKLRTSASAEDPFTREIIQDLEYSFASENVYRSSHHNTYRCHQTERGTYIPASNTSSNQYRTRAQYNLVQNMKRKYTS